MDEEARTGPHQQDEPSAELRERILTLCRREMAERRPNPLPPSLAGKGVRGLGRWSFAAGVAAVLLLNAVEERRSAARIDQLLAGRGQVARAQQAPPAAPGSLRLRRLLLAALLKDPNSL